MSRIVITGGPGAGKTTLLLAPRERGHHIVGDSANFAHHAATPGHVFFDRSLRTWYRRCRYRVIEVPRETVAERCTHVLRALADSAA